MRYVEKSFTVAASAGNATYCAAHGHTMPDVRGDCVRCGAPVRIADVIMAWPPNAALCDDYKGDGGLPSATRPKAMIRTGHGREDTHPARSTAPHSRIGRRA